MKRSWRERAALSCALVLVLAACGSGTDGGTDLGGADPGGSPDVVTTDADADVATPRPDLPDGTGPDVAADAAPGDEAAPDPASPDEDLASGEDEGPAEVAEPIDAPDPDDADDAPTADDTGDAPDPVDAADAPDPAGDVGVADCGGLDPDLAPACAGCLHEECCEAFSACALDATCRNCVEGAVTSACLESSPWMAAMACLDDRCEAECAAPPVGPVCDSGFDTGDATCGTCLTAHCCDTYRTCVDDIGCLRCLNDGTAAGCDTGARYQAAIDCRARECAVACGVELPPDPGAICTSGLWARDVPCGDCAGANCCVWFLSCANDPGCKACWDGTTTFGCAENPWLPAAQQCVSQKCNATCGGLLGGTCGTDTWLPGSQACRDCADANCCGPYGACTADDTCLACLLDPAGCVPNALRDAVDACLDAACAASCG